MNKKLLGIAGILLSVHGTFAQSLVSTSPKARKALLEEFTGIHCASCPTGHMVAHTLEGKYPGQFYTMNVHVDAFATPFGTAPDFRTKYSGSLDKLAKNNGYPSGMINRIPYQDTILSIDRDKWMSAAPQILDGTISPFNIGMESVWNAGKSQITINLEIYCTSAVSDPALLNLAILENHVIGYQKQISGEDNNYDHVHALRDFITPMSDASSWGDMLAGTTQGKLIKKSYTYTVNKAWNIDNCELLAFISQSNHKSIYTAEVVAANGGTTSIKEISKEDFMSVFPNPSSGKLYLKNRFGEGAKVEYKIIDLLGKTVLKGSILPGNELQEIDLASLAPGLYSLCAVSNNADFTTKIVVEKK